MRVVIEDTLAHRETVLRFSASEQATLRKAAAICAQARELWRASVEYESDDEDLSLALGGIEWRIEEVVEGIVLATERVPIF